MDENTAAVIRLTKGGMPMYLAQAVVAGRLSEDEALAKHAVRVRGYKIATLPQDSWPGIDVKWDISPGNFYLALDDSDPTHFGTKYPDAEAVTASADELYASLRDGSADFDDPFDPNFRGKTAELVAYLETGGAVSPAMVRLFSDKLFLVGGNHRFRWARYRGQTRVPIILLTSERAGIAPLIPSLE